MILYGTIIDGLLRYPTPLINLGVALHYVSVPGGVTTVGGCLMSRELGGGHELDMVNQIFKG